METIFPIFGILHHFEFKSYYVVWKPPLGNTHIFFGFWFKSYYVVWKPTFPLSSFRGDKSLNRTM